MKSYLQGFLLTAMLLTTSLGHSAIYPFHTRIYTPHGGAAVQVGQPSAYGEVTLTDGGLDAHADRFVRGILTLGVDHHYPVLLPSMRIKVQLLVNRWSNETLGSADMADTTIFLEISYSPNDSLSFTDKQSLILAGVRKYAVTIQNIWVNGSTATVLPANLYVDADLYADRYYDFAGNAETQINISSTPVSASCGEHPDFLRIYWPAMPGAEEYQLEWTFTNDYGVTSGTYIAAADLDFDFRGNSTRISTSATSYDVRLAFDHGYISYRVRAIGRALTDLPTLIFGVWSAPQSGKVDDLTHFHQDWSFEGDKNWQYATTYAEEGKKKEVASFFDGSLRNRQMVTKINSDNNTIVGETIYDHQGRPAIQVLPVPVAPASCEAEETQTPFRFYSNFNVNENGDAYSRADFDLSNEADTCSIASGSMKKSSGASNYYSASNPDQSGHNAFIPNANGRPFSQVEYTPDNTGRIRRQGGVGENFELGSGHESKYYYSHPTQLQLARMFGSEAGNASHYQKNMVVDPNGQVSVSYLDQEGRVIATSLAGNVPDNLAAIPSASGGDLLTDDMFAADATGKSQSNALSANGKSKVFSETMSISALTTVTFDYGLAVDTLADDCLAENICFSCVYDLTIRIYDECGVEISAAANLPTHAGRFTLENDTLRFATTCSEGGSEYTLSENFSLSLNTGTYLVTKTLTVNEQAKDFYVNQYLDTNINTCIKTLKDFEREYLAATDFSDCQPSEGCAACLEALGTIENFIAEGRGTVHEYQLQRESCQAPCKLPSMCESYKQLLMEDVSPGGQYGEYIGADGYNEPGIYPLSVYNGDNLLRNDNADWNSPLLIINGEEVRQYLEEDGITRSIVMLTSVERDEYGNIAYTTPEVNELSEVYEYGQTGTYYTYPEYLKDISVFLHEWKSSWAASLITYHPEYYFYKTCLEYTLTVKPEDTFTSESFDQLISRVETWQEAIDEGLIQTGYAGISVVDDRLTDWFSTGAHAWDPFVVHGASRFDDYGIRLQDKFSDYLTINGYHYSMPEAAALMTRCGIQLVGNASPPIACARFGDDYGIGTALNDSIRNEEWKKLRALYISAKQAIQQELAIERSIHNPDYLGYNGCIGTESFNPLDNGFFDPSNFMATEYFNTSQPCYYLNYPLYKNKVKRFAAPSDLLTTDINQLAFQQYLLTGQCPTASNLQNFLSDITLQGKLAAPSFAANDFPSFQGVYLALGNYNSTSGAPAVEWQQISMTSTLLETRSVMLPSTTIATLSLELPSAIPVPYTWNDIRSFSNLQYTHQTGSDYHFEITALIETTGGTITDTITGKTTFDIKNCRFHEVCHPNDLGEQLPALLASLAHDGNLANTSAVQILGGGATYEPLVTNAIQKAIHPGIISSAYWQYDDANHAFMLYETTTGERLELKINSVSPSSFDLADIGLIGGFSALVPTQSSTFELVAKDVSGNYLVTLHCDATYWNDTEKTRIPTGECAQPVPASCEGVAFRNTTSLGKLLIDVLPNQDPVYGDGYQLAASEFYNTDLAIALNSSPTTSETISSLENGIFTETTSITGGKMCTLTLTQRSDNDPALKLQNLVSVSDFTPTGVRDEWGNFHAFYLLAKYEVGGLTYEDTIFGTTCLPLNLCVTCAGSYGMRAISNRAAQVSTCEALYDQYLDTYKYFQQQQLDNPTCTNYPSTVPLLTLQDFIDNKICCNPENFQQDVIEGYFYQFFDTPCPTIPLPSYAGCETTYQPDNAPCRDTYREFLQLMDDYNHAPWVVANSAQISYNTFGNVEGFYASGRCYCIPLYADYLGAYITAGALDVLPAPVELKDFQQCAIPVPQVADTCAYLYIQYLQVYNSFQQAQLINPTCGNYQANSPLLSYQDFIDNNICCSFDNMLATVPYLMQFIPSDFCPLTPLPSFPACEDPTPLPNPCGDKFYAFMLALEEYNHSPWALENEIFLNYRIFDYAGFETRCGCADQYLTYLDIYIHADASAVLDAPYSLAAMRSCNPQASACDLAYQQYNTCITTFNNWAAIHGYAAVVPAQKNSNLCGCVDAYCAYLSDVMGGFISQAEYEENPGIVALCETRTPMPCPPQTPLTSTGDLPTTTFTDPCTEFLTNAAYANAWNAYNQYTDSIRNYIAQRYVAHCMDATETFTRSYFDNEYHRTLYYYDQAGNLIKTVPPEGVELLDITSSTDALYFKVLEDLYFGSHQVLTSHRLATTYVYNSLNQLVRQSTPDQDQMDIWEITLPNGLQAGLNTTAIQMVNSSTGYLAGYAQVGPSSRGFLYRTDNGGLNWVKVNNTVASDLRKIQMASATIGYATGKNGTVLKTLNSGMSWDLLNTFQAGAFFNISDLFVQSPTEVYFAGGESMLTTTDGGSTFSMSNFSSIDITNIQSITADSDGPMLACTLNLLGESYNTILHTTTGAVETFKGSGYTNIHYYDDTHAVIGGKGPMVGIETLASEVYVQKTISTFLPGAVSKNYFMNATNGIVLSDNALMYTHDRGLNWHQFETGINDISFLGQTGSTLELLATGDKGLTKRILFVSGSIPQVINHTSQPLIQHIDLAGATRFSEGSGMRFMAGSTDGTVYCSSLITGGYEPVTYLQIGQLNPGDYAKKITLHNYSGVVTGIILGISGNLYSVHRSPGDVFVITGILPGGKFADILLDETDQQVFAFEKNTRKLHKMPLSSLAPVTTSTASVITLPGSFSVSAMAQSQGEITVVGEGETYTSNNVSGSNALSSWTVPLGMLVGQQMNDIATISGNQMIVVGDHGFIAYRDMSGSVPIWMILKSPTSANLQAVASSSGQILVIAGTKGFAAVYDHGDWRKLLLANGQAVEDHFAHVDFTGLSLTGSEVFICGTQGTILYTNDIATTNLAFKTGMFQGFDFAGIGMQSSGVAYAVGKDSKIFRFVGLNGSQVKNVFSDSLRDVHFADANNGTILGTDFFVRQTHDGGTTWKVILPANNEMTQVSSTINRVWTTNDHYALLVGNSYLASISGGYSTMESISGTPKLHAIQFGANPLKGFVTSGGSLRTISLTPVWGSYTVSLGTTYTPSVPVDSLLALHVFENGNAMAVGSNGYAGYLTLPAGTFDNYLPGTGTETFNDVFFHDDVTGYIAGNKGLLYRSQNVAIDPVTYAVTSLSWEQKAILDAQVGTNADVDIKAIAFNTRNTGTWGGNYSTSHSGSTDPCYLRNVRDESGDYSTRFFYDRLGRLVISQNARQYPDQYSYSLYDELGRVFEAGTKRENTSSGGGFENVFGTTVGGQFIPSVIDDKKLSTWIDGDGQRGEVTRSYYDQTIIAGLPGDFVPTPETQRKRITHVTYEERFDNNDQTYDHATHYDYDIHGNVKTLLQENARMAQDPLLANNRFKRMDYGYDLISGNVHRVSYQYGKADQWHHAYSYDADNRITAAYTTTTKPILMPNMGQAAFQNEPGLTPYWDREAEYTYYAHGPLAKTLLGQQQVQGTDYVYTIQGWLKGVNSNTLEAGRDPGADGNTNNTARDAFGFSLHYFDGDYNSVAGAAPFLSEQGSSDLTANSSDLYNGNIGRMVTTITNPTTREILPLGNAYRYDQLNRLSASNSFTNLDLSTNAWGSGQAALYHNAFAYEANGNILKQLRQNENAATIDSLTYRYKRNADGKLVQNRLYHVNDNVNPGTFTDDIDDMGIFSASTSTINTSNNYAYDAEGRLIKDVQEEIENIAWRVDGKVLKISRPAASSKKNLIFEYDAMGNRIAKHVLTAEDVLEKSTYYILDAAGNTMSVYERVVDELAESIAFYQAEKHIYGSSRLGIMNDSVSLLGSENSVYDMTLTSHVIGLRNYELNNHLGNVLSIVSDKPIPAEINSADFIHCDGTTPAYGRTASFTPASGVVTMEAWIRTTSSGTDRPIASHYLPAPTDKGTQLVLISTGQVAFHGRNGTTGYFSSGNSSTLVNDGEWHHVAGTFNGNSWKIYVDGVMESSSGSLSGSVAGLNTTFHIGYSTTYGVRFLGDIREVSYWSTARTGSEISSDMNTAFTGSETALQGYWPLADHANPSEDLSSGNNDITLYAGTSFNHEGNVIFLADIRTSQDYSPFGVTLSGRNFSVSEKYRYGFNSMEKDDEIKGIGNSYDFGARMLDPRLGRWLTIDRAIQPERSPYTAMHNNPILLLDPDGNDIIIGTWKKEDLDKFISELTGITGLNLYVDKDNKLQIAPGLGVRPVEFKGVPIAHGAARDLQEMIENNCMSVTVNGFREVGSYTELDYTHDVDQATINVDPLESEKFRKGYKPLSSNPKISKQTKEIAGTTGMKLFHELAHVGGALDEWAIGHPTNLDGNNDERAAGGVVSGSAVDYENSILIEMGLYIRATYSITQGKYKIIPYVKPEHAADFVTKVLNKIKRGNLPGSIDYTKIEMGEKEQKENTDRDYEANPIK